jgi:DNA end-binding protein Ku
MVWRGMEAADVSGPARFKGTIAIGSLINLPVDMKAAVREEKFSFNQHCREHGCRVQAGHLICLEGGEELTKDDIVRGYGGVAGVDEDYLASLAREKTPVITIEAFVPADSIDPVFFQKGYSIVAQKTGEKGLKLVATILEEDGLVGIGRIIASQKEFLFVLRARDGFLAGELLYWPSELVVAADEEARESLDRAGQLSAAELAAGRQFVGMMTKPFDPAEYKNQHAEALEAYLTAFVAGQQPAPIREVPKPTGGAMDLFAALTASVDQIKAQKATAEPEKPAKGKKATKAREAKAA